MEITNFMQVNGYENVSNAFVYNFENAVRGSKFPMNLDGAPSSLITNTTRALGGAKPASGHDCFLKGIVVVFDLKMSVKMSVQMQRYHFIDFVSSQSQMHCLTKFDTENMYHDLVDPLLVAAFNVILDEYRENPTKENELRLLYNNPAGFILKGQMVTNYLQLKTIYAQRKNHKLPEWREFCKWVESLPLFLELTQNKKAE